MNCQTFMTFQKFIDKWSFTLSTWILFARNAWYLHYKRHCIRTSTTWQNICVTCSTRCEHGWCTVTLGDRCPRTDPSPHNLLAARGKPLVTGCGLLWIRETCTRYTSVSTISKDQSPSLLLVGLTSDMMLSNSFWRIIKYLKLVL